MNEKKSESVVREIKRRTRRCTGSEPFGRLGLEPRRDNPHFQGLIRSSFKRTLHTSNWSPVVKFLPRFPASFCI